jgi:tetratricopeptide (TPR) repeat protein
VTKALSERPLRSSILASLFLIGITWLVFGQTLGHEFVNYDDRTYVYGNLVVTGGTTWSNTVWAFTHAHARNWHPLTTLSHMLDCQLFGLNPAGHHAVNLILHTVSVLLLFFLLRKITTNFWRSLFVAALFAIHPLRVESVAWIAERKDVLSGFFFMLTLLAYVRYVEKQTIARYLTMSILFALGLMSKPMLVTVPFVLLLLDYWPLERSKKSEVRIKKLVVEKIPLLALSAASCLATIWAQSGAAGAMDPLPLAPRFGNALVSYCIYLRQMFWPVDLAVFYPYRSYDLWQVVLAIVLLIGISVLAFLWRGTRPYFFVGWFWFLGMLVPVIGIFQIGLQGHADRYTYLPQIGLYLLVTWSVAEMSILRAHRAVSFGLSGIVIVLLAVGAWLQTSHWKNSETLWQHALAVTSKNDVAHNNLGLAYEQAGRIDDAIQQYGEALKIESAKAEARYDLSKALTETNLGNALTRKNRIDEALSHYEKAVALRPDYADAHFNFGHALLRKGQLDDAIAEWKKTLSIQPDDSEAHTSLANALLQKGTLREAMDHYEKAIAAPVPSIFALNNLAWILSTSPDAAYRNGARAAELARKANQYSGNNNPIFLRTQAAAHAEKGQFDAAIQFAQKARNLAQADVDLAREIEKDIDLYRADAPVRDPSLAP